MLGGVLFTLKRHAYRKSRWTRCVLGAQGGKSISAKSIQHMAMLAAVYLGGRFVAWRIGIKHVLVLAFQSSLGVWTGRKQNHAELRGCSDKLARDNGQR